MTKREAIIQAIKAKLSSVTGVSDSSVYRSRVEAFTRGQSPAVSVEPISDIADNQMTYFVDWTMLVRVTLIVRGAIPDQVADPIIESVHGKIMADQSLGGLSIDLQPSSVSFELIEADQPVGNISLDYQVRYRTAAASVSV